MPRKAIKRRDVFYLATGEDHHPMVLVEVFPDRVVLASGTGALEPKETPAATVSGQAANLMGLNKDTRFYKMHIIVWKQAPPVEANVVGVCLASVFGKLVRMVQEAAEEHAAGTRKLKTIPAHGAIPVDLIAQLANKK